MVQIEQTYTDLEESELFEPYTVSRINDKSLSSRNQEEQIKLTTKPNEKITNHVSATKGYHKNTIYIWDPPDRSLNQVFILDQISFSCDSSGNP